MGHRGVTIYGGTGVGHRGVTIYGDTGVGHRCNNLVTQVWGTGVGHRCVTICGVKHTDSTLMGHVVTYGDST